ncbi:hypothetical protein PMAYCL1PPCAC_22987, partial [Pristionchus mayeri]
TIMSRLLLFLAIFGVSDSSVDFTHSTLYDQYDIFQPSNTMFNNLCKPGCSIYASIPTNSAAMNEARNVIISDGESEKTLLEIAGMIDEKTSQKRSFDLPAKQRTLTILYTGTVKDGGPVLLYVFSNTGKSNIPFEVYEARTMKRALSPARIVTILSPEPFTVGTDATQLGNTVYSYSAGMDNAIERGPDECVKVLELKDQGSFPGFVLNVQLPLLSFYFNMDTPVQFYTRMEYSTVTGFEQFLTSPGFIGCYGMQVYRSSLYDNSLDHTVSGEKKELIQMDATLNVDKEELLVTDITNNIPYPLWGDVAHHNAQQTLSLDTKLIFVTWRKKLTRSAFLLRFTTASDANSSTASSPSTTTLTTTTSVVNRCTIGISLLIALWMV